MVPPLLLVVVCSAEAPAALLLFLTITGHLRLETGALLLAMRILMGREEREEEEERSRF
jgi:hypothetical protein